MAAARIKAEFKNDPMELKPVGRRTPVPRPPPPRPGSTRAGQSKAFVHPDIKPKIEAKPLPVDPPGTYMDYVITSSGLSEWRHDMMKFRPAGSGNIDINPLEWAVPVKLNRKEPKKNFKPVDKVEPARPLLGLDGKPVVGPDGKLVMIGGPDGLQANGYGRTKPREKEKGDGKGKEREQPKRKFKRTKTRQVYRVSDEVRQVRKEERHPWVMESGDGKQVWEGRLEDRGPQLNVLLFHSRQGNGFKAVPLSKWYMFKERPKHTILTLDQAEQFEKDMTKHSDLTRWMMRKTGKMSEATELTLKRENSAEPVRPRTTSDGSVMQRSGTRMLQVRTGNAGDYDDAGDNDDEGGEGGKARRRRERGGGGDGDYDEAEYEEEFADDDEGAIFPEDDEVDEDTKALQEKENRLLRQANAVNDENRMDDDPQDEEEDEDEDELDETGKAMKKALKQWEKGAYADDDDDESKNPYLSSDEEEEEETPESGTATPLPTGVLPQASSTPPKPTTARANGSSSKPSSRPLSRANSPAPGRVTSSSGAGGSSLLAKRATSPAASASRLPVVGNTPQRALSPLAAEAGGRRANSPPRAVSPAAPSLKRKAEDVASPPGGPAPAGSSTTPNKKPRTLPKVQVPPHLVFDKAIPPGPIVAFLRMKPRSTGDCVKNFKDWFKEDARNKAVLSFWIKQIAKLDNSTGESVLKLHEDSKLAQMGIEF